MGVQHRSKYLSDFKRNAVRLSDEPGRTVAEVAENVGIAKDLLYRWRREKHSSKGLAFPGYGCEALSPQMSLTGNTKKRSEMPRDGP